MPHEPTDDPLAERLRLIRQLPARPRIAALSCGLAVADGREIPALATELLELAAAPAPRRGLAGALDRLLGSPAVSRADEALSEVARRWSLLDARSRTAALAIGRRRWRTSISGAIGGTEAERRGALRLISEACDAACASLVVDMLGQSGPIARSAESALVRMAGRFGGVRVSSRGGGHDTEPHLEDAGFEPTPDDRRRLEAQLVRAADTYESHRRPGVLLAALLMLGPPSRGEEAGPDRPLLSWIRDKEHPAHSAFLAVVRRSKEPVVRSRAWLWLVEDGLGGAAIDRLARAESVSEHEAVLKSGHLLLHPLRAKRVGMIKVRPAVAPRTDSGRSPSVRWPTNCAAPGSGACSELTQQARRSLPRWLRALDMHAVARSRAMEPLLADHDPAVRLACVRVADSRMLADLSFDTDGRVARGAVLARSNAGERGAKGLTARESRLLTRHPASSVRSLGRQELERAEFLNGGGIDGASAASRLAARRAMTADRDAFLGGMHARLTSGTARSRLDAIAMVRWLGIADDLEAELLTCLGADEQLERSEGLQLVATAVAALGGVCSPTADLAVRRATRHEADRVRANAVDALARAACGPADLARSDPRTYASMIELKSDGHHRVRANAIRALLHVRGSQGAERAELGAAPREWGRRASAFYEPAGTDELFRMLADERPMHRVAALWLVERLVRRADSEAFGRKLGELCSSVARLAGSDLDERVRSRATRCAQRLSRGTQRGWGDAAMRGDPAGDDQGAPITVGAGA